MYGMIYKATNLVNGKIYIGQTIKTLRERLLEHKRDSKRLKHRNIAFYNAINKYGFDNFNWCIIDSGLSKGELDEKEVYWINFYKSYIHHNDSNGYNSTLGGDGLYGYKPSIETIKKQVESRKWYRHSEKTKKKQSESHKGRKKSEKHKENLSKSRIGRFAGEEHPRSKAVVQLSLNGGFIAEYETVTDGAKSVNGSTTKISRCCAGLSRCRSHKGFIWLYKDDYNINTINDRVLIIENKTIGRATRSIIQLDINGSYLREFSSIKDSVEFIGGSKKGVIDCCKGRREQYKGFKWVYADEYVGDGNVGLTTN